MKTNTHAMKHRSLESHASNNNQEFKTEKIQIVIRARPRNRVEKLQQRRRRSSKSRQSIFRHLSLADDDDHSSSSERRRRRRKHTVEVVQPTGALHRYRCDQYITPRCSQAQAFTQSGLIPLVKSAMEDGFAATVFAYGQSGTGKSYTVFGSEDIVTLPNRTASHETDGLLPRVAEVLLQEIHRSRDVATYRLRLTCVEIYNDQVQDLFSNSKKERQMSNLPLRWSPEHMGFYVQDVVARECQTLKDVLNAIALAAKERSVSSHCLNARSNRSHCLFTIYIDTHFHNDHAPARKYGKITIVDLAGSERVKDTHCSGQALVESGHINKSLSALSNVIHALGKVKQVQASRKVRTHSSTAPPHVPYRDCKLTMVSSWTCVP